MLRLQFSSEGELRGHAKGFMERKVGLEEGFERSIVQMVSNCGLESQAEPGAKCRRKEGWNHLRGQETSSCLRLLELEEHRFLTKDVSKQKATES